MSDGKIVIEVYKNKDAEEFTKLLADPEGRLDTGSASAYCAALSASLMVRAAGLIAQTVSGNERLDYILRNGETIRKYMVNLIDEDVKCRGPLNRAYKEGGPREIEACRQSACCINAEIVNMMNQSMGLLKELCDMGVKEALHYIGEAADLALSAIKASRLYIINMSSKSCDDTYRYVTRRENDITLGQCMSVYESITEKVEETV